MNDELKDEIETLQSVYDEDELIIDHKSDSQLLNISHISKLDKYTEIKLEFSYQYSSDTHSYSISVSNGDKTKKIIPSNILDEIKSILTTKYKEEIDSMPIFQCISYCNDELMNDETLNLSNELKKLRLIDNDAYLQEMNKYRQQCQKNKKPHKKNKSKKQTNEEADCLYNDTMNEAVQELLKQHQYLSQAIPSIENVKRWLESKYNAINSKIKFIATENIIKQFLNGDNKSKQFEVVYHGTSSQNDKSIVDRGLVCGGTKGVAIANGAAYGHGIYCSPSLDIAQGYARGSIFICLVRSVNCQQSGDIYVVPHDDDILPIYLVNGTFCGSISNGRINVNNKIIRFHNTFHGNVKQNNRKVQRKWSAYHKLNC